MTPMKLRDSGGLIGLAALGVTAAVLVGLAFDHVRPSGAAVMATPAPPAQSSSSPRPTVTSEEEPPATPSPEPSASAESPAEPAPGSIEDIRALLAGDEPVVVSVIGDGSGNGDDEWVSLWATRLADDHAVSYRSWDGARSGFGDARQLSRSGPEIRIVNASRAGETAAEAAASLEELQPEAPQLVVVNVGHSESASEVEDGLDDLWSSISDEHPDARGLVVLQNPAAGEAAEAQAGRVEEIRSWAEDNELATLDVNRAFAEADEPLGSYLFDRSYPNAAGSELWASTVSGALGS